MSQNSLPLYAPQRDMQVGSPHSKFCGIPSYFVLGSSPRSSASRVLRVLLRLFSHRGSFREEPSAAAAINGYEKATRTTARIRLTLKDEAVPVFNHGDLGLEICGQAICRMMEALKQSCRSQPIASHVRPASLYLSCRSPSTLQFGWCIP